MDNPSPYMMGFNGSSSSNPGYASALAEANNNFMKVGSQFDTEMHEAVGQHKQNVQDSANADQTFQMLVPAIKKAGLQLDPDIVAKYAGSSLSAKKGMIGALATQYATNMTAQKNQAQMDDYQAQADARKADAKSSTDAGNFLQRYGQNMAPDPDDDADQPTISPIEAFNKTLSEMPKDFDVGRALPKAIDSIQKFNAMKTGAQPENNVPVWTKGPNGEDVLTQPTTKNAPIISPFSKAAARAQEIDEQGKVSTQKTLLPPGTSFTTTANGFGMATLPDGSMKNLGRVPKDGSSKAEFFAKFSGDDNKPAATGAATPAAAAATKYNSANDVKAAVKAGTLPKADAVKILQSQFGMQ